MNILNDSNNHNRKAALSEFGKLMSKADSYEPIGLEDETIDFQPNIFQNCMNELSILRSSKKLLAIGKDIVCPVVAIHGEYDPHSHEGVKEPLTKVIKDFSFVLLKDCGHYPWNETYAKEEFYNILRYNLNFKNYSNSSEGE
jgi:pimeloyl-ACP methyl ester carboxylesterase